MSVYGMRSLGRRTQTSDFAVGENAKFPHPKTSIQHLIRRASRQGKFSNEISLTLSATVAAEIFHPS
jgi:hypothetical protein